MKKLYFFLVALCGFQAFSQITIVKDYTFGSNGNFTTPSDSSQTILHSNTIILADQSILQVVNASDHAYLLKLKANGTIDGSFAKDGKLDLGVSNFVNAVLQNDKIIVYFGPKTEELSNYTDSKIVRYNSNGLLDISFGKNGVLSEVTENVDYQPLNVLVLADQSLLVTNSTETYPKKYTRNGQLDIAAGTNGVIPYHYHFPVGQFSTGKIATCNMNSLSSSLYSFYDLNSLADHKVVDLNNYTCHQKNGFTVQNKTNISTRTSADGLVYSIFNYSNNPLSNFSRLIVLRSEKLDSQFNGAGFVTSEDDENFLDVGFLNKIFIVLNEKGNQKALNAYSTNGSRLLINNRRDFNLFSGQEIELKDNYILVKSILSDISQNNKQLKIEKFFISDQRFMTGNNFLQSVIQIENPVKDSLLIKNGENADLFEIYDMNGRNILKSKNAENINTSSLLRGNYLLKITYKNGQTSSQKLFKN